jgi:hypothetical protein
MPRQTSPGSGSDRETAETEPSLLALYLFDLRAEYEGQLRTLTKVQRWIEEYRATSEPEQRRNSLLMLQQCAKEMQAASGVIQSALGEAIRQIEGLPL